MEDFIQEERERIRRTVTHEIVRMEDDFDLTRTKRNVIVDKIMDAVNRVEILTGDTGVLKEDADVGLRVYTTALKALADVEKSSATAINIKLRNRELDMANAADSKNRIAAILLSVAPSQISEPFPTESLESHLAELFDGEIKSSELKTSSIDLEE